jgi:hypothetical protein
MSETVLLSNSGELEMNDQAYPEIFQVEGYEYNRKIKPK